MNTDKQHYNELGFFELELYPGRSELRKKGNYSIHPYFQDETGKFSMMKVQELASMKGHGRMTSIKFATVPQVNPDGSTSILERTSITWK